jgi:predicted metal-binding membrane protein
MRDRVFVLGNALLFTASAWATIHWSRSMSGGAPMPGGWTLSMMWMRMPGQTWFGATAAFLGMWVVMMVAMMLPSLVPVLSSYRRTAREHDETWVGRLTVLAGAGYFFVWAVYGVVAYVLGVGLVATAMRWSSLARYVPIATGVVLVLAGGAQCTAWKARQLRRCWDPLACGRAEPLDAWRSWQQGLRLGRHCALCCTGFMISLLVTGVMNLGATALVAIAISVERLAPRPERVARAAGVAIIAAGVFLIARGLAAA